METRSNQVLVGGVVLAILAATLLFLVWLSGSGQGNMKAYDIFFKQSVDGLARGSAVSFQGVPAGQITDIALSPENPEFVRVRIEVRDETPVLQGTMASISSLGFTGVSQISLDGAKKGAPPITDLGPNGVPVIPNRPGGFAGLLNAAPQLLERVTTLTERLNELLDDDNQKSLGNILANIDKLSGSLADRGPEIAATLAETRVAVRQAGRAAEQIGNLAQTVDGKSGPLITDLQRTVASANRSMNTLDALLKDARPGVKSLSTQTAPEINALVRDLRVISESLGTVATRLDQGGATSLLGGPRLPDYEPGGGK